MKRNIIAALVLIILAGAVVFFATKPKKSQTNQNQDNFIYSEPHPNFFDASQVSATDTVIKITAQGFEPAETTIQKGQKVTWVNSSGADAWPASNPHPTHTGYPGFDPQLPMKTGQAWSFIFDKTGDWGYHDHLNPSRRGTVRAQ